MLHHPAPLPVAPVPPAPIAPVPAPRGFATEQVHGGEQLDAAHGSRVPPVHLTAGFVFRDFDDARARFAGDDDGYVYSRVGNPTTAAVERRIAALEGAEDAILVGSGQAAVTVALLGLLQAGDHLLSSASIYEGSRGLFTENLARLGIGVDFVDRPEDPEAWRALLRPSTRALFLESIPNPKNDLVDLASIADVAHAAGVPLVVDNTLATPYLLRPLEHGADVVLHSASKFLAGHGASLGGAVVVGTGFDWSAAGERYPHLVEPARVLGGRSWCERYGARAYVEHTRAVVAARFGPTLSPFAAFLLLQGLETLSLRVARHGSNALTIARWLEQRPEVVSVDHAGLVSSPSHELARRYLPRGAGSVFGVELVGGEAGARAFVDALQLVTRMSHLGDVRSLVLHPASTSHAHRTEEERLAAGIWPGLVRLSIGIEEPEDLIADLARGLDAVRALLAADDAPPVGARPAEDRVVEQQHVAVGAA